MSVPEGPFLTDETAETALDELLAEYFARLDAGETVDRDSFIASHPDYADALTEYFDTADVIERLAGPVVAQAVPVHNRLYGRHVEEATAISDTHPAAADSDSVRMPARGASDSSAAPERIPAGDAGDGSTVAAIDGRDHAAGPGASLPRNFGRYRVERCLGQGAMGTVYLAEDAGLDRKVAIKVPKIAPGDGLELLERFYREARSAAGLTHRNICPVYDVGQVGGVYYLTMAYIAGRSLKDFVHPEHLQPQRQVAAVVRKLAIALDHAHRSGILHRDLKPANIMIDAEREPVIMDFGLARRVDQPVDLRVTQSGVIVGTPAYMSPEQVEGDHARIGPASDIYSLGVILYELLTGDLPFKGSLASVMGQILSNEPPPPSLLRPDLDRTLEAICLKMLAKSPADRYATMRDVADALGEYLRASREGTASAGDSARLPAFDREHDRPVGLAGLRSRLHEQQQRAEALIRLRRYDVALRILESMLTITEPSLTAYTGWAERELQKVRAARAAAERDDAPAAPSGRESELELVPPGRKVWFAIPLLAAAGALCLWAGAAVLSDRPQRVEPAANSAERGSSTDDVVGDREDAPGQAAVVDRNVAPVEAGAEAGGDVRDEREARRIVAGEKLTAMAVTPDGRSVLAASAGGHVDLWDLDDGTRKLRLESGGTDPRALAISADGRRMAALAGGTVRVWETDGAIAGDVELGQAPLAFGLSADGERVYAAFNTLGPPSRRIGPPRFGLEPFGPVGPFGPGGPFGERNAISVYLVETGESERGLSPAIGSLPHTLGAFAADGRRAVVASHSGRMTIFDLVEGGSREPWRGHFGPLTGLAFSGNGRRLATFGAGTISMWDATDATQVSAFHAPASEVAALSHDGTFLLSPGNDFAVSLWKVGAESPLASFSGHGDRISGLSFVPGRRLAVSTSWDQTLRIWKLPERFQPSSAESEREAEQPRVPAYRSRMD